MVRAGELPPAIQYVVPQFAAPTPTANHRNRVNDTDIAALDRESYISLATFRRDGRAVETPVWFAARNGKLYVFSEARAGKMKRLRNDSRVRIAPCNVRGKVHGAWREGQGHRVEAADVTAEAYEALLAKYGWQMRLTNLVSRLTGRIEGRAVIEIDITRNRAA